MYTNKGLIQQYLLTDIHVSMDVQVNAWISAVERFINNYTNRPEGFETPESDEIKYYNGNGERELIIDNFIELTSVEILEANGDDVEWTLAEGEDNDYIIFPYNSSPKYKLIMTANSQAGAWYSGKKRIKITGRFGYASTVPADIQLAATILVSEIVKQGRDGGLPVNESLGGDYSSSFETFNALVVRITEVKSILSQYKIYEL